MPRHSQMRQHQKFKRVFVKMIDRTETESMLDLGSEHLADNESIHGSLA